MFRVTVKAAANAFAAPLSRTSAVAGRRLLHSSSAMLADFTIVVPHMSESISEGIVSSLPVPTGGAVAVDQIVCELETDKVSERAAPPREADGSLRRLSFQVPFDYCRLHSKFDRPSLAF
jgi:Biotin-requiring enzyme